MSPKSIPLNIEYKFNGCHCLLYYSGSRQETASTLKELIEKPLLKRLFTMVKAVKGTYRGWWSTGLAIAGNECYHPRHNGESDRGRGCYHNPAKAMAMGEAL